MQDKSLHLKLSEGVTLNYFWLSLGEDEIVIGELYFPADKSTYTMYKDELQLLTNMDGSKVKDLEFNVNYQFQWDDFATYICYANQITGKNESIMNLK